MVAEKSSNFPKSQEWKAAQSRLKRFSNLSSGAWRTGKLSANLSQPALCHLLWTGWSDTASGFPIPIFCRSLWHPKEGRYEFTGNRVIFFSVSGFAGGDSVYAADGSARYATGKNQAPVELNWKARKRVKI